MPFRSKKQRDWLKINRPDIYRRWKRRYGLRIRGKTLLKEAAK